jgi:peptidoglycan hydrolase CwlO-like protein
MFVHQLNYFFMILTKDDFDALRTIIREEVHTEVHEALIPIRSDIEYMKKDIEHLKKDVSELKFDVMALRDDIAEIKFDIADLKQWRSEVEKRLN